MKSVYPRIRYCSSDGLLLFREGVSINFYFLGSHDEIAPRILQALDVYLKAVGPEALGRHMGRNGRSQKFGMDKWRFFRRKILQPISALVCLEDALLYHYRYRFEYHSNGGYRPNTNSKLPQGSAVSFWLPTEYLEEHGPSHVRELVLNLANSLPFCSGHAGLSFNGETHPLSSSEETRALCFRHPGMDCDAVGRLSWSMGPRMRGVYWLTFLGQPLLGEMGGAAALRSRLTSSGTHVQEMDADRAVITLGSAPEAGDLEQGQTLPAYRELARVLEPWLHHDEIAARWTPDQLRWERRFLD